MKTGHLAAGIIAAALLVAPVATWACKAAGANTHVGMLKAVKAKSFTIIDAETRSPITFLAEKGLIKHLKGVRGMIQVLYEEDEDALRAIDVLY